MKKCHIIYGLFDPNTKDLRYIGYTSNKNKRLIDHHKNSNLKKNTHKNNWIKSLLFKNQKAEIFILEIYETAEELPQAKTELIEYYRSLGCNLTNGGDSITMTEEIKNKISKSNKDIKKWLGKKHTIETKIKTSESKKNNKNSLGYIQPEEHRNKISESIKLYWKLKKQDKND